MLTSSLPSDDVRGEASMGKPASGMELLFIKYTQGSSQPHSNIIYEPEGRPSPVPDIQIQIALIFDLPTS